MWNIAQYKVGHPLIYPMLEDVTTRALILTHDIITHICISNIIDKKYKQLEHEIM